MNNIIDLLYGSMLADLMNDGAEIDTRNSNVRRVIAGFSRRLDVGVDSPLITLRHVAWKTALREYEWFLSGNTNINSAHPSLAKWWEGQLLSDGTYPYGYSENWRAYSAPEQPIDQLEILLEGLRDHPNSRRHVVTLWNPAQLRVIPLNPKMPTTCHGTLIQCFVEDNKYLHLAHYQRSADIMLGLPHNFVQYAALVQYLAYHAGYLPGVLDYKIGDLHLYQAHESMAKNMIYYHSQFKQSISPKLIYTYSGKVDDKGIPIFLADDFTLDGKYNAVFKDTLPLII